MSGTGVEVLTHPALAGAAHGFLGRAGGVSEGLHAGLNVSYSEDDPALTAENRRRAGAAVLPGAALLTCYQIHSAEVVTVTAPWADRDRPRADALVTDRRGLLLGVLTADCAPVLFHDAAAGVVGAAHAGWKGAICGVTDATVTAMERLGAQRSRIAAAIGPCIAQASYEVDQAFHDRFCAAEPDVGIHFVPGAPNHWQFDLEGYVASRLIAAGLPAVERLRLDTYAMPQFYSYRRACHRAEASYGRQISLISLV